MLSIIWIICWPLLHKVICWIIAIWKCILVHDDALWLWHQNLVWISFIVLVNLRLWWHITSSIWLRSISSNRRYLWYRALINRITDLHVLLLHRGLVHSWLVYWGIGKPPFIHQCPIPRLSGIYWFLRYMLYCRAWLLYYSLLLLLVTEIIEWTLDIHLAHVLVACVYHWHTLISIRVRISLNNTAMVMIPFVKARVSRTILGVHTPRVNGTVVVWEGFWSILRMVVLVVRLRIWVLPWISIKVRLLNFYPWRREPPWFFLAFFVFLLLAVLTSLGSTTLTGSVWVLCVDCVRSTRAWVYVHVMDLHLHLLSNLLLLLLRGLNLSRLLNRGLWKLGRLPNIILFLNFIIIWVLLLRSERIILPLLNVVRQPILRASWPLRDRLRILVWVLDVIPDKNLNSRLIRVSLSHLLAILIIICLLLLTQLTQILIWIIDPILVLICAKIVYIIFPRLHQVLVLCLRMILLLCELRVIYGVLLLLGCVLIRVVVHWGLLGVLVLRQVWVVRPGRGLWIWPHLVARLHI